MGGGGPCLDEAGVGDGCGLDEAGVEDGLGLDEAGVGNGCGLDEAGVEFGRGFDEACVSASPSSPWRASPSGWSLPIAARTKPFLKRRFLIAPDFIRSTKDYNILI